MIEGINTQNLNNYNYAQKSQKKSFTDYTVVYPQYKEISKSANNACIAYASPIINKMEVPQMPMDTLIKKLKAEGKKEGKDFIIENYGKNKVLTINNRFNKPAYVLHYDNGNLNSWNDIENYKYKNGKLSEIISKHGNNKVFIHSSYYDNDEIPQSAFTKEGLTYKTTPEEYIKMLDNKRFKIDTENNLITVFNTNGYKNVRWINSPNGKIITISVHNDKNEQIKHITLEKNHTEIDNYFE